MKRLCLFLIAVATAANADQWTGQDKTIHLAAGAATGALVTGFTKREGLGIAAGCGLGALKEIYDSGHKRTHTPSAKDFGVTCAGAFLGSALTGFTLRRNGFTLSRSF